MMSVVNLFLFLPKISAQAMCPLDSLKPVKVRSLDMFKRIPVLNQGRIKPLDSYAKSLLLQLSGRQSYQKEEAAEWLARFLFSPRTTYDDKIFLINNPDILEALKVKPDKHRRYSYHQLEPGYEKLKELAMAIESIDEKMRSTADKEIQRVYGNMVLYIQLSGAAAYAFPHPDFTIDSTLTRKQLGLPEQQTQYSFYDMLEISDTLSKVSEPLAKKPEAEWSEQEKDAARILGGLSFWSEHYANCPLGLIPSQSHDDEHWQSPMDTILSGFFDPSYKETVKNMRGMSIAYWNGSQIEFDISAKAFIGSVKKLSSPKEEKVTAKIPLEIFYNKSNFFFWAKLFYLFGFFVFLFSLISNNKILYSSAILLTIFGFFPHIIGLILRVIILSRPPVSNLFETFIFVSLICVVLGMILEYVNRNWLGIAVSTFSGLAILTIAGKFSAEGDTLQMLVAVLNSNFWLSTHVIAITIGYAGCCVAGVIGHIYILQALSRFDHHQKQLEVIQNNMMGILGFGLIMTFLGTALGGIWADQSWGRFWGWDPKENGALMIVLWCAIIFHARIAKIIHPLGAAVGCILTLVNVMWAWFGVNLLNVGLHSYGFTSGIANTLAVYVLAEIIFICTAILVLGQRNIKF